MSSAAYLATSLIMLSVSSLISGENHCCRVKTVGGDSSLAGVYFWVHEGQDGSKPNKDCMDNCVYVKDGKKYCFGSKPTYPVDCNNEVKYLWVGPGAGSGGDSEVMIIPGLKQLPNIVPPYPLPSFQGGVAQLLDKTLHVCGGLVSTGIGHGGSSTMIDTCYNYTLGQSSWKLAEPMLEARWGAASVQLEDVSFWVTGGYDNNNTILKSTEIWNEGSWTSSIDLPIALEFHCMVQINATHTFLSGGWTDTGGEWGSVTGEAWIYDGNGNFAKQQNMATKRFNHACALYGGQIWVVGGQEDFSGQLSSTEIFDLATLSWLPTAPALPVPTSGGRLVYTGKTLLFIGGVVGEGEKKTQTKNIYKLEDGLVWTSQPVVEMESKRAHFNALVFEK